MKNSQTEILRTKTGKFKAVISNLH